MEVEADGDRQHRQVPGVAGLKEAVETPDMESAVDSPAGILRE